jgi:hypothetical protein
MEGRNFRLNVGFRQVGFLTAIGFKLLGYLFQKIFFS